MNDTYQRRCLTLDPGVTALALRGLQQRRGHYPFIAGVITRRRRQNLVVPTIRVPGVRVDPHAYLAVVRRGNDEVFLKLIEYFRADAEVKVLWDRRLGERRSWNQMVGDERRRRDRRCVEPALWENADYLLVPRARWLTRHARFRSRSAAWLGAWQQASRFLTRRDVV